ncbi:Mph(E)/Mph(G) family macrolide 2'-phosphotransferase [Dyadobacter luteus]|uniref:Mph(E)/Mph(G) family macrolide 2'-phosphotransferase n=1 Tax=Dyadobacter luteus TaxID=2259619 RepID=A0A3D8YIC9_9BACT|nr:Mph(E)/Mph(G) family macrolide 2'-phosphotransferase [Dyadobacter luteus]REA64465.1 Mph(E)/Mph(G) family macrolide 2'-phosphotransferase [Dyadobacter luteus]
MTIQQIQALAQQHGLLLSEEMAFNEMGIDFKIGFAKDLNQRQWVLRVPRRNDLDSQIESESRILDLVKKYLSVQVPDWKIASSKLVAYPLLKDPPALSFDEKTYEVTWHFDQHSPKYVPSLAKALVELHNIPLTEVIAKDLKVLKPQDLRAEISERLALVKSELGISQSLQMRYQTWLDNDTLWPDFTCFIHGDLYAGHTMATADGEVSGIIDWSTAHVSDLALDFSGHVNVFGEKSLRELINEYEKQGGRVFDKLYEQSIERAAASALAYGFFAVQTNDQNHIAAAKVQLGV